MASVIRGSDNFDSAKLLGVGQTWQNVTASRAASTDYTNNTGKPIVVHVYGQASATSTNISLLVDGLLISQFNTTSAATDRYTVSAVVPPGSVYRVTVTSFTISMWAELR